MNRHRIYYPIPTNKAQVVVRSGGNTVSTSFGILLEELIKLIKIKFILVINKKYVSIKPFSYLCKTNLKLFLYISLTVFQVPFMYMCASSTLQVFTLILTVLTIIVCISRRGS